MIDDVSEMYYAGALGPNLTRVCDGTGLVWQDVEPISGCVAGGRGVGIVSEHPALNGGVGTVNRLWKR